MSTTVYYNEAARLCGMIMKELEEKLCTDEFPISIKYFTEFGNRRINDEISCIYKKIVDKGIASPVSVSLNDCVGNSIDTQNFIIKGDIVKIEFSVNVSGYVATICETFLTEHDVDSQRALDFLNKIPKILEKLMVSGETNDEVKIAIESECTVNEVFPIENCVSYQQQRHHCQTVDSKFIVLNHNKIYDDNDILVSTDNECFEFEENEVYTINLTVIPSKFETVKYVTQDAQIYRFNELQYQLKLKSSRAFLSQVKSDKQSYKFDIRDYNSNPKHRMGIRECHHNGILEAYPIVFVKSLDDTIIIPVFSKKFTVIVKKNICYLLKY